MWIEATRIGFIAVGGVLAAVLCFGPRLACRFYAEAFVRGRYRAAGFWAFLAGGGGSPGPSAGGVNPSRTRPR